jgi:hypothetical protein
MRDRLFHAVFGIEKDVVGGHGGTRVWLLLEGCGGMSVS